MNTEELIEFYEKKLKDLQEYEKNAKEEVEKYKYGGNKPYFRSYAKEIDRYSSLLSILCATQIRTNKTEIPKTGRWILFFNRGTWIHARYDGIQHGSIRLVSDDREYLIDPEKLIWFFPPQLPEVCP